MTTSTERVTSTRQPRPTAFNTFTFERDTTLGIGNLQLNRASVGAVILGALGALVIMLAMSVLGVAIGATTLDAMIDFDQNPAFDPEIGVIVWLAVTNLLALFTGGWIAGRLAGSPIEVDGVLHGFITWGLVALLSLWLFGTVAGSIVNGAIGAVGDGLSVLDDGVAAVVPEAIQAVEARDIRLATIRAEARNLAEDTENPSLQPDSLEEQGEEAGEIISQSAENIAVEPVSAGGEIEQAVDRLMNLNARTDADREDLVQLITANSDLSEEEARTTITNWEQVFDEVSINTEATINEVSETVTEAIAKAAGVVFMTLALGALAAMAGGYLGSPEMTVAEAVHVHEIAD